MTRFSVILLGVLGVQLGLALILSFSGSNYAAYQSDEPLLAFERTKIDGFSIGESGGNSVELVKKDDRWIIPAMADFPANQVLADKLLDKLSKLEKGWPIATTSDAAERFKLTDENHERQIILKAGDDEVARLMIGSAPAFKLAHARIAGENEIYNVKLATYEAGARGEEWMDRDYLDIDREKITAIEFGDIKLERKDDKLIPAGLEEGETAKLPELSRLIHAIAYPTFETVVGTGQEALAKLDPAELTIEVQVMDGDPVTYRYKKEKDGDAYLLGSSAHDFVFRVAAATIETLVKAKREDLINAKKPEPEPPVESEAATPSPEIQPSDTPDSNATGG